MSSTVSLAPAKSREILPLTGIRGIAATAVVLYHWSHVEAFANPVLESVVGKGYLAVDLFFVLSGFVLGLSYGGRFASGTTAGGYRDFIVRRLARIYPMYFIVTLVYVSKEIGRVHFGGVGAGYSWMEIVGNFLMVQSWGLNLRSIGGPTWSLSAEFFAYLAFPAFVALTLRPGAKLRMVVAMLACGAIAMVALSGLGARGPLDVVDPDSFLPLLRCVGEFTLGLLAYRSIREPFVRRAFSSNAVTVVSCLAIVGFCTVAWGDPFAVLVMPILIVNLYFQPAVARAVFGNPVVHHVGAVSYSLYLVHPLLVFVPLLVARQPLVAEMPGRNLVLLALYAAIVWATSFVCYTLIEKPGTRLAPRRRTAGITLAPARTAAE